MNCGPGPDAGTIMAFNAVENLQPEERAKYAPIVRDLTAREEADAQIRLYSPCGCGSGKKFKFCCRRN